jgi:DNA invertase Pin-like site-specific DNA recombinase
MTHLQTKTKKYVVALYIRLSLEDEITDSMSIENQRLALHQYADNLNENDIEIQEYVDNGYSGTNFERPAVQELLELVQLNKIDCIIVKDFSRFGRDSLEVGYLMERVFPVFRTRFISIQDCFDSGEHKGDTGGIDVAFKYLINEYYSRDLSEKMKSANRMLIKKGEKQNKNCIYGYKKGENNRLEPDPETVPIVKMIFDLAAQGKTVIQIREVLYEKKIMTPGEYKTSRGVNVHDTSRSIGIWQLSTIRRILYDERYTGMYIGGMFESVEVGKPNGVKKDKSEWIKIPNHHLAIVDKVLYDKVNSMLVRCKCIKRNKHEYPLMGKLICGCCKHSLKRNNNSSSFFFCDYTKVDKSFECHGLKINGKELETSIFDIIKKQTEIFLNLDKLSVCNELLESQNMKLSEYESRIQEIHNNKRSLYEQFITNRLRKKPL